MNQDQKMKLLQLTRAQAERLLSGLTLAPLSEVFQEANGRFDEPAEVLLFAPRGGADSTDTALRGHKNYHVRYKAWRALGSPVNPAHVADTEALLALLHPSVAAARRKAHAAGESRVLTKLEVELGLL